LRVFANKTGGLDFLQFIVSLIFLAGKTCLALALEKYTYVSMGTNLADT
jgi:hypothetical protein